MQLKSPTLQAVPSANVTTPAAGGITLFADSATGHLSQKDSSNAIIDLAMGGGIATPVAITDGGTGQITQQAAINALAGAQTANRVLRSDGTNTTLAQVNVATDVTGTLQAAQMPAHTGDVTSVAGSLALAIAANAVANADLAQAPANTVKGNGTGATANITDLTTIPVAVMPAHTGEVISSAGSAALSMFQPRSTTTALSAAITNTLTYVSASFPIAANSLKVGDTYRLIAYGACTSTAANTSTFVLRFGTAGTTADGALLTFTATGAASGTNVGFRLEMEFTVWTIGATGTGFANAQLANNGTTGVSSTTNIASNNTASTTINTTVANFLGLSYVSSTTTTSVTFKTVTIERMR